MLKLEKYNPFVDFLLILTSFFIFLSIYNIVSFNIVLFALFFVCFKISLFFIGGIYKTIIQFWTLRDTAFLLFLNISSSFLIFLFPLNCKLSIFLGEFLLTSLLLSGIRFTEKYFINLKLQQSRNKLKEETKKRTLIIGAGEAGFMTMREIRNHPESHIEVIGFIDDAPEKIGMKLCGKKVFGDRYKISEIVKDKQIDLIILAIPSAPAGERKRILDICEKLDVQIKVVPSTIEIIKGDVKYEQIRDLNIEELLSREEIRLNNKSIERYIKNKKVLITGAGGSIGAEIARQVTNFKPAKLILLGKGENSIFYINLELTGKFKDLKIYPAICDIRDKEKVEQIFKQYKPDIVFHSAAHKHVYLMELHPDEAFKNNVIGTLNLAEIAIKYNAKRFILISTDKAVYPKSIMGITKRIAENIVLGFMQAGKNKNTKFIVVRFGNVFASRGSVVPIFQKQIESGGPVTVTHPDVVRYFMTIPEAVQLVLQASTLGKGGEIFILDMGKPVKISDLAKRMIRLSGYEPGKDIKIKYTGLKPGEKLKEELFEKDEKVEKTIFKEILKATPHKINFTKLINEVKKTQKIISTLSKKEIRKFLKYLL